MSSEFTNVDPYKVADDLHRTAGELVSDMTSLTVTDLAEILHEAADFITFYADEHNSYVSKTSITLNIGRETMDLTSEILPMLNTAILQDYVRQAIRAYTASGELPNLHGHGHDHPHSH